MLKLNIWTPSLSGKRAVMFYIHGGRFEFGSSYELPSHEGAQMACDHDVVQVSVNHRLNLLGFLDLSERRRRQLRGFRECRHDRIGCRPQVGSGKYRQLWRRPEQRDDLRSVRRWRQGGHTDGHAVRGRFVSSRRNSIGPVAFYGSADESKEFGRLFVKELGIDSRDIASLQKMDWAALLKAADAAQGKMPARNDLPFGKMPGPPRRFWMPTVDGHVIPNNIFHDGAPEISKSVPLIIGSVSEEGNSMNHRPTEAKWRANLIQGYGEVKGRAIADALMKAHPEKSVRTLSYMCGGGGFLNSISIRNSVVLIGEDEVRLCTQLLYTRITPPGSRRCLKAQAPGTLRIFSSASTTPNAVNRGPEIPRRHKLWRRRRPRHGRILLELEIRASLD